MFHTKYVSTLHINASLLPSDRRRADEEQGTGSRHREHRETHSSASSSAGYEPHGSGEEGGIRGTGANGNRENGVRRKTTLYSPTGEVGRSGNISPRSKRTEVDLGYTLSILRSFEHGYFAKVVNGCREYRVANEARRLVVTSFV